MKLTDKEATLLATLYETPAWGVFRKRFMEERQLELAQQAPFSADMDHVAEIRGSIMEIRQMEREMRKISESQDKKKRRTNNGQG